MGAPEPGTTVASAYRLERVLGRGGMSSVWLATDVRSSRSVAIKFLAAGLAKNAEVLARFHREAEVARAVKHPGVVEVLGTGIEGGSHYIVMELLEGETAEALLAHSGPITPGAAAALAVPVLDVLEVAHRAGVVHRDLKPANVFLTAGRPRQVKVLDFGVATPGDAGQRFTRPGMMMGTLGYMAPEQVFDAAQAGPRADLYSLGAMLFQLLSGRLAFSAPSANGLVEQILTAVPPPLSGLAGGVPPRLSALVAQLLRKAPEERPPDAAAVRRALLEAVEPDDDTLFAGFGESPRRSAVLVRDDTDGLGETFQRPSPMRPPLAAPGQPAEVRPPAPVRAPAPAGKGARGWVIGGALLLGGFVAAAAVALLLERPAPVITPPPAVHLRPADPIPAAPTPVPAPTRPSAEPIPLEPLELEKGSRVLPAGDGQTEHCRELVRAAEKLVRTNPAAARLALADCLRFDPEYPPALYLWGELLLADRLPLSAIWVFQLFLESAPANHPRRGDAKLAVEQTQARVRASNKGIKRDPPSCRTLLRSKLSTAQPTQLRDLERELLKGIESNPLGQCNELVLADLYDLQGDAPNEVRHDLRYLDLCPECPDVARVRERLFRRAILNGGRITYAPSVPASPLTEP